MSKIWPHVTKQNPCGICHKPDWCQIAPRGWRCYRVPSPKPFATGGWFHPFNGTPPPMPKAIEKPKVVINCKAMLSQWRSTSPPGALSLLANNLGVPRRTLEAYEATYAGGPWAWPMRDGYGNVVGIRLRADSGRKWAVKGSTSGLFIPQVSPQLTALICEGPTSAAAGMALGYYTLGTPSAGTGLKDLNQFMHRNRIRRAIIVGDNKCRSNGEADVGIRSAETFASHLPVKESCVLVTPAKDLREFWQNGGTHDMIEELVAAAMWRYK